MHKIQIFFAVFIAVYTTMPVFAQSDPPTKQAPDTIQQPSPQGHPGQLKTDDSKGSPPTSPQGGTPNAMQAKPKGEDKGETK